MTSTAYPTTLVVDFFKLLYDAVSKGVMLHLLLQQVIRDWVQLTE